MTPEIELLEKYSLTRDEDSLKVEDFGSRRLLKLNEQLYSAIHDQQRRRHSEQREAEIDPFTFMASASLRADSTCGEFRCRAVKLDFLARYAALYANNVILPLPMSLPEELRTAHPRDIAHNLSRTIQSLLQLRPLIEAGVITPVIMKSFHCVHTYEWAGKMIKAVRRTAVAVARNAMPEFRVIYQLPEKSPSGESTLYINGPDDMVEHGGMVVTFQEGDEWRLKRWRFDREGRVEIRGGKKLSRIYDVFFMNMANDTSFYLAFAQLHSARYLSDRSGETMLLDALVSDQREAVTDNRRLRAMAHMVPLLGDLPISTLVRIRREDRDAFARYQYAVRNLFNDIALRKRQITKREVVELFRERVAPELARMKSELQQERKRQTRRVAGGIAGLAAGIGLGAFGFLPVAAASAAVGASLLSKAAGSVCEHGADLAAKNDFYFLLKATKESGME